MRRGSMPTALLAAAATLVVTGSAAILPYNPTSIFLSPNDTGVVYVLDGEAQQLHLLNISESLSAQDVSPRARSIPLPFLEDDERISYSPAVSPSGSIAVFAGTCDTKASLWAYTSAGVNEDGDEVDGKWVEKTVKENTALKTSNELHKANFMSTSLYFSSAVNTTDNDRSIYSFGGLCPLSKNVNKSTWQSEAIYSNTMLKISPESDQYEISLAAVTGLKPVPEAGFTMTGLVPTYSNSSDDTMTQAQTYVLIGGHTESAFIGMGQVALFSLPQESWSFQQVAAEPEAGIEASSIPSPDSRSGHTAVLSSDGSRIIVFGGWVGDINTPAEPQLTILKLGAEFGGEGQWMWETPEVNGTSLTLDEGRGIYGHGAVMLPGDVMIVAGGFRISESSMLSKRQDSIMKAMFLNTTSMSWIDEYKNPTFEAAKKKSEASEKPLSAADNSKRVAIGTGVGVGVAAIIGAVVLYFWYQRKLNRKRHETRERDLAALSQNAHRDMPYYGPNGEMQQRIGAGVLKTRSISTYGFGDSQNQVSYGPIEYTGYDHEEDRDISYVLPNSSLARNQFTIPRKPPNTRNARGYYQPTPVAQNQYDFGGTHSRANSLGTAGAIHPIYEADEDDHGDMAVIGLQSELPSAADERADPFTDPSPSVTRDNNQLHMQAFVEPPQISPTRSPSSAARERDREIKEWVSDWAAADAYLARDGSVIRHPVDRLSPGTHEGTNSNSGRTGSNLSEQTQSEFSLSRNDSTSTRTKSLTAFFTGGAQNAFGLFGAGSSARRGETNAARRSEIVHGQYLGPGSGRATAESYYTSGSLSPDGSDRGTVIGPSTGHPPRSAGSSSTSGNSGGSFITAQSTSFPALREQGEVLLPRPGRQGTWDDEPGSPSKSKPMRTRNRNGSGWLGSIKKALGREEWVPSPGVGDDEREVIDYYRDSPSPTRQTFDSNPFRDSSGYDGVPQRTVSASAQLWRRKQGRGDWEDSEDTGVQRSFTTAVPMSARDGGDEEWDVEKAVMGRQVQIIGTVPKERLRVVNHDVEVDDGESDIGMMREREGSRTPVQDMLTGSPMRGQSPERPERAEQEREPFGRSLELNEEIELQMQPPSRSDTLKGKGVAVAPLKLRDSPLRHLPPPRDEDPETPSQSPARSVSPAKSMGSLSPTKSVRSIKSGRVGQLVQQLEKRGSGEFER